VPEEVLAAVAAEEEGEAVQVGAERAEAAKLPPERQA
jgi:hypothetical protein